MDAHRCIHGMSVGPPCTHALGCAEVDRYPRGVVAVHPRTHGRTSREEDRCLLCMKAVHPWCDDCGSVEADRYLRGMAAEPPSTHAIASTEAHRDPTHRMRCLRGGMAAGARRQGRHASD